jgi:hypothetical protein
MMRTRSLLLGAGALVPALSLLPADPASASTEFDVFLETRDVTVVDRQGQEHDCTLTFELAHVYGGGPTPPEQQDSAWAATKSGTEDGDPACAEATVEVSLSYSRGGADYTITGTRSGPWEGEAFTSVDVSVLTEVDPATGGPLWIDRLSSTHQVYFPACECSFTEKLVAKK